MVFTRIQLTLLASFIFLSSSEAFAAGTDAGTLEQILKKQIETEKNKALPETLIKKEEPTPALPSGSSAHSGERV